MNAMARQRLIQALQHTTLTYYSLPPPSESPIATLVLEAMHRLEAAIEAAMLAGKAA